MIRVFSAGPEGTRGELAKAGKGEERLKLLLPERFQYVGYINRLLKKDTRKSVRFTEKLYQSFY